MACSPRSRLSSLNTHEPPDTAAGSGRSHTWVLQGHRRVGRVRRLRVPALRRGVSDREGHSAGHGPEATVRLPAFPAEQNPSARGAGRGDGGGGGGAGQVWGEERPP